MSTSAAGPSTYYDQVGVLLPGQTSAIIGRNPGKRLVQD